MRLLILTQVVDSEDPVLGFFHAWIQAFAQEATQIQVVCLRKGKYALPKNVSVYSLGKEEGSSKSVRLWRFYRYLFSLRSKYDAVFVHMNPEYVVLGGIFWRLMHKRVGLWFTHKSVNWRVRVAARLSHVIFTASRESFRLTSEKMCVTGHGIDAALFSHDSVSKNEKILQLISVGRISPIKRYELMFQTLEELALQKVFASLTIIGEVLDEEYAQRLKGIVAAKNLPVVFRGGLSHDAVPKALQEAEVFLSCSDTGGLDKALLEAWAAGLYVVTTNDGVGSIAHHIDLSLPIAPNPITLAQKIGVWNTYSEEEKKEYRTIAQAYVAEAHSLSALAHTIVTRLTGLHRG